MRDELKEKIKCNECGLPVEICNICVFASMQSHLETEKERAAIAGEYRADILAYTEKECQAVIDNVVDILIDENYIKSKDILPLKEVTHANCCACQTCGYWHDQCICESNYLLKRLNELKKGIK
jgi:hypothetical protein